MTTATKSKSNIAKEIMDRYQILGEEESGFSRNNIRVLDMFVAACIHFLGEMSNARIAKICMENINTGRKYTSDNVFQSRKRHKEFTDPKNEKYNPDYLRNYEQIVLSKSLSQAVIALPKPLKK